MGYTTQNSTRSGVAPFAGTPKRGRIHANRIQAEVQAFSSSLDWTPPSGTLGELTRQAHERASQITSSLLDLQAAARDAAPAHPFAAALRQPTVSVIAEVKRWSPSKGAIAPALDAAVQAAAYAEGGAAAISVLTEPTRFGGAMSDLLDVASRVTVPVIRKDFLVHPAQLWEARAAGASAALLIVRALSPDELVRLMDAIHESGLEALVEVRDEHELARALAVGARVIGVNNRNLETLVIDVTTAPTLIPSIPADRIAVAESGLLTVQDMAAAAHAGADAILVGSAVSAHARPADAVRAMTSVPRHARR